MEPRHRSPVLIRQEASPTGSQFARPSSLTGRLLLRGMNIGHSRLHRWGLEAAGIHPRDKVLDVGCGGGRAIAVDHLPFRDGFFDVVTAFETTYFWPDLQAGLIEIRRVLSPGGRLVITNEVADREAAGHWAERLGMNVPDGRSLAALAHEAGFLTADISLHPRHGWLRLLTTG